jgi:two-component system, NtrC family, sensor kinase
MNLRSLAPRFILLVGVVLFVAFGVDAFVDLERHEGQLLRQAFQGLHRLGDTVKNSTRYSMLHDDREAVTNIVRMVSGRGDEDTAIRVFNKDGEVMFASEAEALHQRVSTTNAACAACHQDDTPRSRPGRHELSNIYTRPDGERVFQIIHPITNERDCWTAACHVHDREQEVLGILETSTSLAGIDRDLAGFRFRKLASTGALLGVISLVLFFLIQRIIWRPVHALARGTRRLARGEFDHRISERGPTELAYLARAFNQMAERLQETRGQLLRSERLASLGRLSAGIAHEINNPLTGILLLTSTMIEDVPEDDPMRENLSLVVQETQRSRDIIRGLLDFARQTSLKTAPSRLEDVARKSARIVQNQAAVARVELRLPPEDCAPLPPVLMDAAQIQQVVLNLMINGVDAMSEGGTLTVGWRLIDDGAVALTVQDTGSGIPAADRASVFEPFFSTKGNKGTGLGLAIAWGIVDQHGGELAFDTVEGEGTTFTMQLPVNGRAEER